MELSEADKKKVAIFALSQTLNPEAFSNIADVCNDTDREEMSRQHIFILASVCTFNLGAMLLVFSNLDWFGLCLMSLPALLLIPLPKSWS